METAEHTRGQRTVPVIGIAVLTISLAVMATLSRQVSGHLPDLVTFVGTGRDGTDQHAAKWLVLSGLPLLTAAIAAVLLSAQRLRRAIASTMHVAPWRDDHTHRRNVDLGLGVLTPVLLALHVMLLRAAEGRVGSGFDLVAAAVALVVVIAGNLWPKQVPAVPDLLGTTLDPRTRQRLDTHLEAQRRHLRPTGIAMVALGLVALACSWLSPTVSLGVSLAAILVMAGILSATAWRTAIGPAD